jgi:hypothetical protein
MTMYTCVEIHVSSQGVLGGVPGDASMTGVNSTWRGLWSHVLWEVTGRVSNIENLSLGCVTG